MREFVKVIGFSLVTVGFIGLVLTDFVFNWGRAVTITFAAINALGLITLGIAHWGMRRD